MLLGNISNKKNRTKETKKKGLDFTNRKGLRDKRKREVGGRVAM